MDSNFYMTNRQKLLFMVEELHKRGFQKLRVIPSLSPSGMNWRCRFVEKSKRYECLSSNWICDHEIENSTEELEYTTQELADLFTQENKEFIEHCKGEDEEYKNWYSQMLRQLKKDELPYAFADWGIPEGTWRTSEGNEIKTLPNEDEYYF